MECYFTIKRGRRSNCVRYYIFCERDVSVRQPLRFIVYFIVEPSIFFFLKLTEYDRQKHKNYNVTHNVFVDGLKLYASSANTAKKPLDPVTAFSKDTGMTFGDDKCAYQQIQTENFYKALISDLEKNLSIKPIKEGDAYKYLGIDKNISDVGPINKT